MRIISLFVLAAVIYILISFNVLQKVQKIFEKKPEKIDEQAIGIICKQDIDGCFYFNKDGIIFREAPNTSGNMITLIKDYSKKNYQLNSKILEKPFLDIVVKIKDDLSQKMGLKAASFDIESYPAEELRVVTSESWYILFSLDRDISSQLLALKAALDEKIENRMNLQYIDLRIENRIYYK